MLFLYLFAVVPACIGGFLFYKNHKIIWQEWLIGSLMAFLCAGLIHIAAYSDVTTDYQTLSGSTISVSYHPAWTERWTKHHSETYYTGSGDKRQSHTRHWTTTEYDHHSESWYAERDFGSFSDSKEIYESDYVEIKELFGGVVKNNGKQSYNHLNGTKVKGDNNIYTVFNETAYKIPTTTWKFFRNKVKAAPTLFSFAKIPTNVAVFPYPANGNWRSSDRVLGTAAQYIDNYKWDCMNSVVGPFKKANVIIVGFDNLGSEYGRYQESEWIGGKKNDLVITFGTKSNVVDWVYVFGWTENEMVKKNIQSILLTNPLDDSIIPIISEEISKNYRIKDWSKFNYISVSPPKWMYWVYFVVLVVTQVGLYVFFHKNTVSKSRFHR